MDMFKALRNQLISEERSLKLSLGKTSHALRELRKAKNAKGVSYVVTITGDWERKDTSVTRRGRSLEETVALATKQYQQTNIWWDSKVRYRVHAVFPYQGKLEMHLLEEFWRPFYKKYCDDESMRNLASQMGSPFR